MKRRDFLSTAGVLAGGAMLPGCGAENAATVRRPREADQALVRGDWNSVRGQFALRSDKIHMSALLVSSHPRSVREAIERYRSEIDADPADYLEAQNNPRTRAARQAAADYIGESADDVALTDSTTMGIGLVYNGLTLRPGDELVTTTHDYYSTHEALRHASVRAGATVRQVTLFESAHEAGADLIVERIRRAITPATRVLALTWVHSSTGLRLPMNRISQAVADLNRDRDEDERVLICLDGVHGFGVVDVTMQDLGCDFFMSGCHKWLFGPRGTGIVWGKRDAWRRVHPIIPSFTDDASWDAWSRERELSGPTTAARMMPGGFKPFEHVWAISDAFEFHQVIGKPLVAERTFALSTQLKEGLAQMPNVRLHTPMSNDLSAGIVCFDVDGLSPDGVVRRMAQHNVVAMTTPYAESHARLTPCIYNTPEEVETALGALRDFA